MTQAMNIVNMISYLRLGMFKKKIPFPCDIIIRYILRQSIGVTTVSQLVKLVWLMDQTLPLQ